MTVRAVSPSVERQQAFLAMLDDFDQHDPHNAAFYALAKENFPAYVQGLLDEELGLNLADGWVPCMHRWLVTSDDEVVGVTRLRHTIDTPFLASSGGHIGFDVAPSHRRCGYGHFALAVALTKAGQLGLARALLYAAEDNVASRAVIEQAGGHLESIFYSEFWHERLCKYWLAVKPAA